MPKSLEKTRKAIAKKKGNTGALHENSRDSQRLRRAGMRDEKLAKVAAARRKQDQPLIERTAFFQEAIRKTGGLPLQSETIYSLIETFVHQHDEEFDSLKRERRPGRPASTKEDLLRMKIANDLREYENGFFLPDLTDADNVVYLDRWDGAWSYLPTLKWIRMSKGRNIVKAIFSSKTKS